MKSADVADENVNCTRENVYRLFENNRNMLFARKRRVHY